MSFRFTIENLGKGAINSWMPIVLYVSNPFFIPRSPMESDPEVCRVVFQPP